MDLSPYAKGYFGKKDIQKFFKCTKLISRGVIGSSSYNYSMHPMVNVGHYNSHDIVGVSVNGNYPGRIDADFEAIQQAVDAKATIITDKLYDRNRDFNIGEKEVANFLINNEYVEISDGIWKSKL